MSTAPKLRSSDIDPLIAKAQADGSPPVVRVFEKLQEILGRLDAIETEDARRETILRAASAAAQAAQDAQDAQ